MIKYLDYPNLTQQNSHLSIQQQSGISHKTKLTFPTQDSSAVFKDVILIPDFSEITGCKNNTNSIKNNGQGSEIKETGNIQNQSLVYKYLWEHSSASNILQHSKIQNINFREFNNSCLKSKILNRPQYSHISQIQSDSIHYFSINQKLVQNSIIYRSHSLKRQQYKANNLSEEEKISQTIIRNNKINSNINVWHTHGLKFGTQLLKFGIRKKNIVIVVYHKLKNQQPDQSQDVLINRNQQQFSKQEQKWSNFIRQANKKCFIGHLYISDNTQYIERKRDKQILYQSSKDKIEVTQIPQKLNQFRVSLQIRTHCENSLRVLTIIENILNRKPNNSIYDVLNPQIPENLEIYSNQQQNFKQPIPQPPKITKINSQQKKQLSLRKPRSNFFLHTQKNKSTQLRQRSKSKKSSGIVVLSKRISQKRKQFQFFNLIKNLCSTEAQSQKNQHQIQPLNLNFILLQNKKMQSNPIKRGLFNRNGQR